MSGANHRASTTTAIRLAGLILSLLLAIAPSARAEVEAHIFEIIEAAAIGEDGNLLPEPLMEGRLLQRFYEARGHSPAWEDEARIRRVVAELEASVEHGLNPDDYHVPALYTLADHWARGELDPDAVRARFDVLMTDAVLHYAAHLQRGKVDPSSFESSWNFEVPAPEPEDVAAKLTAALEAGSVVEELRALEPDLPFYDELRAELARYRGLAERHAFVTVPDDAVLRPGTTHANVPALREQLRRLGYSMDASADDERFGDDLARAVEAFQRDHGLADDGVVGAKSFAELNRSYAERVDQLRVNLDRVRWVHATAGDDLVLVNVAAYELYLIRNAAIDWETDVMVGTVRTQTPFFHSSMTYLVINPTWTVPTSIIRKSLAARFEADPGYAAQQNYLLYDRDGDVVDPAEIDWTQYGPRRFPFRVVQQPGPGNALGRVKFMFPNEHAIYLHDTPSRDLFERSERAFSHGCIRVRDPLEFAAQLLRDEPQWDREAIAAVVDDGTHTVVRLDEAMPVMLMYWTASPGPDGGIQLHPDIYDRDGLTLAALDR